MSLLNDSYIPFTLPMNIEAVPAPKDLDSSVNSFIVLPERFKVTLSLYIESFTSSAQNLDSFLPNLLVIEMNLSSWSAGSKSIQSAAFSPIKAKKSTIVPPPLAASTILTFRSFMPSARYSVSRPRLFVM